MDFGSLPLSLLLLLPGFLLLHLIFLVSRIRRISAFYATMWSLSGSLILIITILPLYTLTVPPPNGMEQWPGLREALTDPKNVPGPVWSILYATAFVLGIALGYLDRKQYTDKVFSKLGIDLRVHDDLWSRLLRDKEQYSHVIVHLKDGELVSGWPAYVSNNREQPGPEIYLEPFRVWDPDQLEWAESANVYGTLIHGNEISRIEFISKDVTEDGKGDA